MMIESILPTKAEEGSKVTITLSEDVVNENDKNNGE